MTDLTTLFDRYSRQARLAPALLVVFPAPLLLLAWFPDLQGALGVVASLAGTFGVALLMGQLARDRGKRLEPLLFEQWGGKPSVSLLRWRDSRIDRHTKERYRRCLAANLPNVRFPDASQELADTRLADESYEAATQWLLAKTRDTTKFRLVFQESISYGFRRNVLGLRPAGMVIAGLGALATTAVSAYQCFYTHVPVSAPVAVASGIAWLWALWWLLGVKPAWVRLPADQYGKCLLAACTDIDEQATHG